MDMDLQPLGYNELIRRYDLDVLTPYCSCWLAPRGGRRTHIENNFCREIFSLSYDPGNKVEAHLVFALKYEGINLEILSALFKVIDQAVLTNFIKAQPTGRYARLIWFFYEWLTGKELPLNNIKYGNYIPALDPAKYYVLNEANSKKFRRQRITCNLLGTFDYCPLVRKSKLLKDFEAMSLNERANKMVNKYPEDLIHRATQYLYAKETKSSFEIEKEHPDKRRTARFVELLHQIEHNSISKSGLIRLQKEIVDKRFALDDFRNFQNYIGETLGPTREIIHFVAPKPENINSMMEGWIECSSKMLDSNIPPIVTAAVISYGFVFLHPFWDGNGRLHRYLIHHVLRKKHFTPAGLIFPISATMLKKISRYDDTLEHFSREVMQHVEYRLNSDGEMTVLNETVQYYRYQDMTFQAEALFEFVKDTIENELNAELEYLNIFDKARKDMREIVDMPDRKLDLFIRISLQNHGKIPKNKQKSQFSMLTDNEINRLLAIVQKAFKMNYSPPKEEITIGEILLFSEKYIEERNQTYEIAEYHPGYYAVGQNGGGILYLINDTNNVFAVDAGDPSEPTFIHSNIQGWIEHGCPDPNINFEEKVEELYQDLWALPGISVRDLSRIKQILGLSIGMLNLKKISTEAPCVIASNIPKPVTIIKFQKANLSMEHLEFRPPKV